MTTIRKVGICMDHAHATLMEYNSDSMETTTIDSDFTHEDKEHTLHRSEKAMHNKEQHEELEYYKSLGERIRHFDDVLLFGPTDAKVELVNLLRADQRFEKIRITVEKTDKMTENQQHAFVKDYFSRRELV